MTPVPHKRAADNNVRAPSPAVRQALSFIEAQEPALLAFTRDLIATPSPTPPGDERAVAARITHELQKLNLGNPEIIAGQPERPNLLLRVKGAHPGPALILNGHIDTNPPANWPAGKLLPSTPS